MATANGPLNLMACVRESSPQDLQPDPDTTRHETSKKRRFHPFRGLRRMFRRKVRHEEELPPVEQPGAEAGPPLDSHRSRSTSELLAGDEPANRRRSGNGLYPCHSGLSVSHDSVFTAEQRTPHSSSEDLDTAQSSSSLSIQQLVPGVRAELFDAVRRRRGRGDTSEDDEDLGLPRSPCNSPTTADVLLEPGDKENPTKSRSTCSDGSLLSMGSSEMDEDSLGQNSGHSSKLSLHDKKTYQDNDLELDLGVTLAPLSHSAARHKMAVRPKRTHGAPRRRRIQQQIAASPLPTTPEVNEELSARSASPVPKSRHEVTAELSTSDAVDTCASAWLSATDSTMAPSPVSLPPEIQLKSASLPPGLALSSAEASVKVARSHSNAACRKTETSAAHYYKRTISASELDSSMVNALASEVMARNRETFSTVGEEDEDEKDESNTDDRYIKDTDDKKEESFFGRLLLRRSGKKKKDKPDDVEITSSSIHSSKPAATDITTIIPKRIDDKGRYANETVSEYSSSSVSSQSHNMRQYAGKSSSRSSAASRQRVEPINLPPSPECPRRDDVTPPVPAPRHIVDTEPTPLSRMQISYSVSPPKPTWPEPRFYSNKTHPSDSSDKKQTDFSTKSNEQQITETDHKSKLKIAGLSSDQQRITQIGSELDEREFSSLIATGEETFIPKVSVKKSQSFRGDVDVMSVARGMPFGLGASSSSSGRSQDMDYKDIIRKSEEARINARRIGSIHDLDDRLSFISSKTASSQIFNGERDEDERIDEERSVFQASEKTTDIQGRQFTKNVYVSSKSVMKENNVVENKTSEGSMYKILQSKQTESIMKKSSSLDSISSLGEVKKPASPQLGASSKKSSSSESISSYTQQVTGPVGPTGITITQTVRRQEETFTKAENVTVAVQSAPAVQAPSSDVPQEVQKQPETPRSTPVKAQQEKETSSIPILTPRSQLLKRETRPIITPERQIPEFLRVQLNRVDSKPAVNVVLSTSAVFDMDKSETPRMQSRLRVTDDKQSVEDEVSKKEETGQISSTPGMALRVKKEAETITATPTAALRVKRKSSREESSTTVKEMIKPIEPTQKLVESSTSANISTAEVAPKASLNSVVNQEPNKDKSDNQSATAVKTQRSVSVVTAPSSSSRKSSIVSISSGSPPSPSAKTGLKKQACSLDSAENRKAMLKKQKSFDFENITIVEKEHTTAEVEVVLRKKSLPWEIVLKRDEDNAVLVERPASVSESVCSQESVEIVAHKQSKSREFGSRKEEDIIITEKQTCTNETQDISSSEVVLRKKSVSREIGQRKEEEPELLKVFARRSLKLKDSDSEALSQQVTAKARESQSSTEQQVAKSRDSDKENEGGDSPREERKKLPAKESLTESKVVGETIVKSSTIGITLNNPRSTTPGGVKYQRCFSSGSTTNNENNETILAVYQKDNTGSPEKRQRNKSVPESSKTDTNHVGGEKNSHRAWTNLYKENNIELNNSDTNTKSILERVNAPSETQTQSSDKEESNVPRFKRIQQRKEEWEQRAQQAAKKTLP